MRFTVKTFTKQCYKVLKTQVLKLRPSYDLWSTSDAVELRDFQKEVLREAQKVWNKKKIAAVEVFCAGGKTIMAAWLAVEHLKLHPENRVVFCSPKRDAFLHFEAEFRKVLSTHGLREDLVYARHNTSMPVFPVDKRVLIAAPYDLVGPAAMNGTRKVIEETLKRTKLFIADEVHRYPGDAENTTEIIGKIYPLVQELAIPHGARVLTMTGTHYRACDDKHPFGIEKPDIKRTLQDMILSGSAPQLCGFPIPIEIKVRNGEIKRSTDTIHLKFHRRKLLRYLGLVADTILKVVEIEAEFAKSKGAAKPGGHAIAVSRQKEAVELCAILNRRLGWEAFVAYTADALKREECLEVQEKLRDGRLLGYATVMKGVESINVPRLKYAHIVARITSDNKLMQFVGRVLRLPGDADCALIKNTAVVLDYQVKKLRIIRLAKGIRDIQRQGGSLLDLNESRVGDSLFKTQNALAVASVQGISLGEYETWLRKSPKTCRHEELKRRILSFVTRYRRLPMSVAKTKTETTLAEARYRYCNLMNGLFDAQFQRELLALCKKYKIEPRYDSARRKTAVLRFIEKFHRLPTRSSETDVECRLADWRFRYTNPNDCRYDAEFSEQISKCMRKFNLYRRKNPEKRKVDVVNFIRKNRRLPQTTSKDIYERKLRWVYNSYCGDALSTYDKKFHKQIVKLLKKLKIFRVVDAAGKQRKILLFIAKHQRLPSGSSSAPHEERQLSDAMHNYASRPNVYQDFLSKLKKLRAMLRTKECREAVHFQSLIIKFIHAHKRFPKQTGEESFLYAAARKYIRPGRLRDKKFCVKVAQLLVSYGAGRNADARQVQYKLILAFVRKYLRFPSVHFTRTKEERKLGAWFFKCRAHVREHGKKSLHYAFMAKILLLDKKLKLSTRHRVDDVKLNILEYISKHRKLPKWRIGSSAKERHLSRCLAGYRQDRYKHRHGIFLAELNALCAALYIDISRRATTKDLQQEIFLFLKKHKRLPKNKLNNRSELRLARRLAKYLNKNEFGFVSKLKIVLRELGLRFRRKK